jgi:hypothetical protein
MTVEIGGRVTPVVVNERDPARAGVTSLGKFSLPVGNGTVVTLSNAGTDGYVVVDGLQIVRVDKK